jgi:phage-related protein
MVTTGYAIGPAIAVAVGAISSLVSGFVALSASVLSATPSLIVLPSLLTAIGQAALVAKAAFGGIGEALKQMTKTGGGGGGGGEAAEEARRKRIEAAEKNLARVLENNRESLARANRNLTDAEERLTDARKEAAESLQQLNFDAEDAAISEKRAAIQLEKARETLARVQDLPPNSRARREAELAYAEADLNLRRAKDRNADLAKETEEANAKGVEGSEAVVNATRAVEDAAADLAKTERDALRSQVDAEEALADAKKETAKAGGGASATDAYDKLSEAAKNFVDYLISIKPKLQELKDAAQGALLPPLQLAIDNLVQNLFPRLIPIIEETGKALGLAAIDFSNFVTEGRNLDKLDAVAATNVDTISKLGVITGNLYDVFLSLLAAADPLIRRFTDWLVTLTTGWQETRNAKLATGELTDTFNKAGDVAAQLGEIFSNIGGALMNIGRAATGPGSGGQKLLDLFTDSTARFEEFTQKLLDNGRLEKFFNDVADNVNSVSQLIVDFVKEFLKLGDDPGISETAQALRPFMATLGEIFAILQSGSPALADFLDKLAQFLLKFTETGSINAFFGALGKGLDVLNAVFGNATVQKILLVIAPIFGVIKALTLMSKVGGFGIKVISGYFFKAQKLYNGLKIAALGAKAMTGSQNAIWKLQIAAMKGNSAAAAILATRIKLIALKTKLAAAATKVWAGVQAVFNAIMSANPIALIVIGIAALIAAVVLAYKKFEWFRNFVHTVLNALKTAFTAAWNAIKTVINVVWNTAIKPVFNTIASVFTATWGAMRTAFEFVWNIIKTAIELYWNYYIKPIFIAFRTVFELAWSVIRTVFTAVWDFVSSAISTVWSAIIEPIFNNMAIIFGVAWEVIKTVFLTVWNIIEAAIKLGWEAIKLIFEAMSTVFELAWDGIKIAFEFVWNLIRDTIDFYWNNVIKPIFEAFQTVFELAWDGIKTAFTTVWDAIKAAISWAWNNVISPVFNSIGSVFSTVWEGIESTFGRIWDGITSAVEIAQGVFESAFNFIGDLVDDVIGGISATINGIITVVRGVASAITEAFKGAWNFVAGVWNNTIGSLSFTIPKWVPWVGGNSFSMPKLGTFNTTYTDPTIGAAYNEYYRSRIAANGLADGGTVPSTPGGMLALIGEGGRPERVEPLDPDGLSRRDKAMIQMLAGPGAGKDVVINVYPSKGMDEAEVASMVSRQLAFQLRRGAA